MGVFNRRPRDETDNVTPLRGIQGSAMPSRPGSAFERPRTTPQALPFKAHRNLTAAAQLVDIQTAEGRTAFSKRRASQQGWQEEAWLYADAIGEISYAFSVVSNALSRVRLYTAEVVDPAAPPSAADPDSQTGQASIEVLDRLSSAFGGVPGLLRDAAMNLQVSGECLLVQQPANPFANPPTSESWDIRSVDEMNIGQDGRWVIIPREDGDKSSAIILPKNAFVARIWRPHPRWSDSSTSSVRPVLDLCAELMLLNKTFRATARSRLNSGILYLPDGLSVAATGDPDTMAGMENETGDPDETGVEFPTAAYDSGEQADTDDFEEALLESMMEPIADEESAAAVVPLLVRGPAELGEKIRLIQFERTFDPMLADRSDKVLDRIMQGLDVPKEVVKGLSSLKFSTAQIVDIQLYQAHVEPLALLICDALTTVYLRPALRSLGLPEEEIRKHVVWYDPSEVTTRPNRAEDADKGFDNYLLSGTAWRRAHNYTDDDAPNSTELAIRMLIDKGQITPELAESLLAVIAPEIMSAVRDASIAANPTPIPDAVSDILDPSATEEPPLTEEPPTAETPAEPVPDPFTPAPTPSPAPPISAAPGEEELI